MIRRLPFEHPWLGRHIEHDERSRAFASPQPVDESTWRDRSIRIYDPTPNPNQAIGNCTMCAKGMQLNAVGNRRTGVVLGMDWAVARYSDETANDEFAGSYPPDDTGSSGLASAKTVQRSGEGGAYRWRFDGARGVVTEVMAGNVVSVGTRWEYDMFNPDSEGRVHFGGGVAGGHQWVARGYWRSRRWVLGRCWWGEFRDFWISLDDLDNLLADDGDAHVQARV